MDLLKSLRLYDPLFKELNTALQNYNSNLMNDIYEKYPDESEQSAFKRGETFLECIDSNSRNLRVICSLENQVMEFFKICKENEQVITDKRNDTINKKLRYLKVYATTEDYLRQKSELDQHRQETPDAKNRRETEEMLQEIKEKEESILALRQQTEELLQRVTIEKREHERRTNNFEQNPQPNIHFNLSTTQINVLERWTQKKCAIVLFDSDYDNWAENTSVFLQQIRGKGCLAFLIEDTDGEKFGYYLNASLYYLNKNGEQILRCSGSFEFNLQSQNNRLSGPKKFDLRNAPDWRNTRPGEGIRIYNKSYSTLIGIGSITLRKENSKSFSECNQNDTYNYNNIKSALCGKSMQRKGFRSSSAHFTPKRIQVIQMK